MLVFVGTITQRSRDAAPDHDTSSSMNTDDRAMIGAFLHGPWIGEMRAGEARADRVEWKRSPTAARDEDL